MVAFWWGDLWLRSDGHRSRDSWLNCLWNSCAFQPILSANSELSRDPHLHFSPFFLSWVHSHAISVYPYHGFLDSPFFFIMLFPVP